MRNPLHTANLGGKGSGERAIKSYPCCSRYAQVRVKRHFGFQNRRMNE